MMSHGRLKGGPPMDQEIQHLPFEIPSYSEPVLQALVKRGESC